MMVPKNGFAYRTFYEPHVVSVCSIVMLSYCT